MAADLASIFLAALVFPLVTLLPGYAFGWLSNVLQFRCRSVAFRFAASLPLSLAVVPVASYLLGTLFSLRVVLAVYLCLSVYTVYKTRYLTRSLARELYSRFRTFFAFILVWISVAVFSLADWQIGRRLYFSIIGFDYAVRTAFTQSINAHGLPAQNPFFYPGRPVTLRYHYYWLVVCSLVPKLTNGWADARHALIAGSVWCGIALICLIPLYLKLFSQGNPDQLRRRSLLTIALLGVTGLDILPTLLMARLQAIGLVKGLSPSVEWWNNQVDGWIYTMIWEPHYLCALISCFTGFLILWDLNRCTERQRAVSVVVAGFAFASAAGSGIYVAFVFAAFLLIWILIAILNSWFAEMVHCISSAIIGLALSLSYLFTLHSASGSAQGSLFQLTIRSFAPGEIVMGLLGIAAPWKIAFGNLVFLPLNYCLELGVFFVAGYMRWRAIRAARRRATREELATWALLFSSITICTFVKSGAIANNDLGWRGFLVAQFVLLLWGGEILADWHLIPSFKIRALLLGMVVLGAAGVVYDLTILRFFPLWSDEGRVPKIDWLSRDAQLGKRTYANREAYEWLRTKFSKDAIIQQNPTPFYQDTFFGLYGQSQTVAENQYCGTAFGGNPQVCAEIIPDLKHLYERGNETALKSACAAFTVDVFIAKDTDAAWQDRSSWIWTQKPVFRNDFVRLFPCRSFTE